MMKDKDEEIEFYSQLISKVNYVDWVNIYIND